MQKIFATGHFMSACRRWNEKPAAEKTWTNFKSHFAAAHRQHRQIQGDTAANAGYYSDNAAMTKNDDHMAEVTIGALENLATAAALRPTLVLSNNWKKTLPSCEN
jgi:hypothetical protein